jgi:hypothetical protein
LLLTTKQELLMPPFRSFSELELAAQPMNKLRLVCMAECEPVCSIDWLVDGRPLVGEGQQQQQLLGQAQEIADNQTRIFKSARRLESPASLMAAVSEAAGGPAGPPSNLVQVDNLIHRRTGSSSERFPWYRQTGFGQPVGASGGPPAADPAVAQVELASRQLMRDSYELAAAAASNVFSKLELSYSQIGRLLLARPAADRQLVVECRPNEMLDQAGGCQ